MYDVSRYSAICKKYGVAIYDVMDELIIYLRISYS